MSGGAFNYDQYRIGYIADEIDDRIFHNGSTEQNEYGDLRYHAYPPDIIEAFKRAANLLREAQVYAHRIDWLLSGDDGEDSFRSRLRRELDGLKPYQIPADDPAPAAVVKRED